MAGASIDERIVAMGFENDVFEQRAAQTLTTLGKLSTALKDFSSVSVGSGFDNIEKAGNKVTLQGPMSALDKLRAKLGGAGQGAAEGLGEIEKASSKVTLEGTNRAIDKTQAHMAQLSAGSTFTDIEKAADRVSLEGISRAIDSVSSKFGILQTAASVAIGNITSQAAMKGAAFAKSFALGPITDGFKEYSTNLNSIQTILANTQDSGGNLKTVNAALQELNTYSDKTIYNFSEMAKNIGTFTAAGVQLKPATAAIKGIANLAALSGSNSQQASTAMYQLSQAIAAGKVGLQDWNSVVNAGMGGAVFQKALMRTAENLGTVKKGAVEIDKATGKATVNGESFRESISAKPGQQSWLTSDVLTKTLSQFTGDLSDAQLAAQGFTADQIKAIQAQAKTAQAAATEVKTLPQVFDVARETIGSGWGQTFQTIFGDFGESKKTFTELSNTINSFINTNSNARNKILKDWKELGGRTDLLSGIKAAFSDLADILNPIKEAFREVFPATTGKQLSDATKAFRTFFESLNISSQYDNLKRTFAGIFAIFDIARHVIGGVIGVIFDLLGAVSKGAGGFLGFTGGVGDFLVAIDNAIAKGGALKGFFAGLSAVLKVPIHLIEALAGAIANLFGGDHEGAANGLTKSLDDVNAHLGPLKKVIEVLSGVWDGLVTLMGRAKDALQPWFDVMVGKLSGLGDVIANAFKNMDFEKVMSGIQTGLIAGLLVTLKKALGGGMEVNILGDAFKGINTLLGGLTKQLEVMQNNVKANTLAAIAASILILAAGIKLLSTIDGKSLAKSMAAVAVGLGELALTQKVLAAGAGFGGSAQFTVIAAGLIALATAVVILAAAMKIFATMSWDGIAKGLIGVAGSIGAVGLAMNLMPKGPLMIVQGAGLVAIGLALNIIAAAMAQFGKMKLQDVAKGVFSIVEALGGIALGVDMMPPTLPLTAAGLILMGIALSSIGGAIGKLGNLSFPTLIKGLAAMMAALVGIGIAVSIIPPTIGLTAVGLLIVGQALIATAAAIAIMGKMSVGGLVKGIVGLAGALIVLAGGLTLMIVSAPGAVALMGAAAALAVLVPVLGLLGVMKWDTIFKGLAAIALVLGTIGVVGLIAAPGLSAIGIALVPLGLGLLLVAKAAQLFGAAISVLSTEGQKGFSVFMVALTGFIALLPNLVINFLKGILSIADGIVTLAPKLVLALGTVLDTVIAFVIEEAPKLAVAIGSLVDAIVQVLAENTPKLVQSGIQMTMNLLNGLDQNIGQVTDKVTDIIVKFLDALNHNAPRLIDAGSRTLKTFLDGMSSRFGEIGNSVGTLIAKFIEAVGNQAEKITSAAAIMMGKFVAAVATFGPKLTVAGVQAILDFLGGLDNKGPELIKRGIGLAEKLIKGLSSGLVGLANTGLQAIVDFLNGIADAIRTHSKDITDAGINIGSAIIEGVTQAFGRGGGLLKSAVEALFAPLPGWAKKILGIKSPSTVFEDIGVNTLAGFSKGIAKQTPKVRKDVEEVGKNSMAGMAKGIEDNSPILGKVTQGAIQGMLNITRGMLGIHSPSEVFRDIGMNVNHGFRDGLLGSKDEVINAFDSLNSSLIDKIRDLRSQVSDGNSKLTDLQQQYADKLTSIAKMRSDKKPDISAINDAVKESQDLKKQIDEESASVDQNGRALTRARDIRASLTGSMKAEKDQLLGLKKQYDDLSTDLQKASDKLQAAQDMQKKYIDQFDQVPDVNKLVDDALAQANMTYAEKQDALRKQQEDAAKKAAIDQVALYEQALQAQIVATAKYQATLQKLKDLGLDDQTYQKLLDQGLAGQDFADQLAKAGKAGIDKVNALDAQLLQKSADLANQATEKMLGVGVAVAQGIVDGIKAKQAELDKQMTDLADVMVNAIKSKLKIKSPSQVFAELGKFTAQGLAQGMRGSTGTVTDAASSMGDQATAAIKNSLSGVLDAVGSEIDPTLTITPVLDMTQLQKDASQIKDLGNNVVPITTAASYGQAATISAAQSVVATNTASEAAQAAPTFQFEQNNYSPESLSEIEIYRQTKNQFSQLKGLVGIS